MDVAVARMQGFHEAGRAGNKGESNRHGFDACGYITEELKPPHLIEVHPQRLQRMPGFRVVR
jgi:hypothetical protein